MKKCFSILFLSIYLISLTELSQLAKLPILIEHFSEHKKKNNDLSFWDFLCTHYVQHNKNVSDYDKDMKLPFKSHDGCVNSVVIAFVSSHFEYGIIKPISNDTNFYSSYIDYFFQSSYLASIWQPPKSC